MDRSLEDVQLEFVDPKTGKHVTKPILDATEAEIQLGEAVAWKGFAALALKLWPMPGQ
jgi:hypothetical protein